MEFLLLEREFYEKQFPCWPIPSVKFGISIFFGVMSVASAVLGLVEPVDRLEVELLALRPRAGGRLLRLCLKVLVDDLLVVILPGGVGGQLGEECDRRTGNENEHDRRIVGKRREAATEPG